MKLCEPTLDQEDLCSYSS